MRSVVLVLACVCLLAAIGFSMAQGLPFATVQEANDFVVDAAPVTPGCGLRDERGAIFVLHKDNEDWVLMLYRSATTTMRFLLLGTDVVYLGRMEGAGDERDTFLVLETLTPTQLRERYRTPCGYFTSGTA